MVESGEADEECAPGLNFSGNPLDFGYVQLKETACRDITVANYGKRELNITNIQIFDDPKKEFVLQNKSCASGEPFPNPFQAILLESNKAVVISVKYTPTDAGTDAATLSFTTDETCGNSYNLGLVTKCKGTCALKAAPEKVDFETLTAETTPPPKYVDLKNECSGPDDNITLEIDKFQMTGSPKFFFDNVCKDENGLDATLLGYLLAPNKKLTCAVNFLGSMRKGDFNGEAIIGTKDQVSCNLASSGETVSLHAAVEVGKLCLMPASGVVSFCYSEVGTQPPATMSAGLRNCGDIAVKIKKIYFDKPTPFSLAAEIPAETEILPGEVYNVPIIFAPQTENAFAVNMLVDTDIKEAPYSFTVLGRSVETCPEGCSSEGCECICSKCYPPGRLMCDGLDPDKKKRLSCNETTGQYSVPAESCKEDETCVDGSEQYGSATCKSCEFVGQIDCFGNQPKICDDNFKYVDLPACDDKIACTQDLCNADKPNGCEYVPIDSLCNDANDCTIDKCDPTSNTRTKCVYTNRENGSDCTDELYCTVNKKCSEGQCMGETRDCNADASYKGCKTRVCNEALGQCKETSNNLTNGTPCDDGNAETIEDVCSDGVCFGHPKKVCEIDSVCCPSGQPANENGACPDDGNPCTNDQCIAGTCTHTNKTGNPSCDDELFCNGTDTCNDFGVCLHSGNPCLTGDVCNNTCNEDENNCFSPNTTLCRDAIKICDSPEYCDGQGKCPQDKFFGSTILCRPSLDLCDEIEYCKGDSPECPPDEYKPNMTVCRPSNGPCDAVDFCSGDSPLCINNKSNDICRDAVNDCDVIEICNGVSDECPSDAFAESGIACGDMSESVCSKPDTCDGEGNCMPNHKSTQTVCRESSGECDAVEFCDGQGNCPSDVLKPNGSLCRASADQCDAPEYCTGLSTACPDDAFKGKTEVCREAEDRCDKAEFCTGDSPVCPLDLVQESSFKCRDKDGECDLDDYCDGKSITCADLKSTAICRNSAGECDQAEFCNGVDSVCPIDAHKPDGTLCGSGDQCFNGACVDCTDLIGCFDQNWGDRHQDCSTKICDHNICDFSVSTGKPCDDENLCTSNDFCQADGSCSGTQVSCGNHGACNPLTGQCVCQAGYAGAHCESCNAETGYILKDGSCVLFREPDYDHDKVCFAPWCNLQEHDTCPTVWNPDNDPTICAPLSNDWPAESMQPIKLTQSDMASGLSKWRRSHEPIEMLLVNVPLGDLNGYWKLNGWDASDYSGHYNNGNLVGNPNNSDGAFNDYQGAMTFYGSDTNRPYGYISIPVTTGPTGNENLLRPKGALTIMAWYKGTQERAHIFSNWWGHNYRGVNLHIGQGCRELGASGHASFNIGFSDQANDCQSATSSHKINDGNWHHIVGVFYGNQNKALQLYIDGHLDGQSSGTISSIDYGSNYCNIVTIGANCDISSTKFANLLTLDEVILFNRALSAEEIATYFKIRKPLDSSINANFKPDFSDLRVVELSNQIEKAGQWHSVPYELFDIDSAKSAFAGVRFFVSTEPSPNGSLGYEWMRYAFRWGNQSATYAPPELTALDRTTRCTGLLSPCIGYAGWYRFNESIGEGVVDQTTHGLDGVYHGSVSLATGAEYSGITLNGSDAWIEIPDATWLDLTRFTVEGVYAPPAIGLSNSIPLIGKDGSGSGGSNYLIKINAPDASMSAQFDDDAGVPHNIKGRPISSGWEHFAYSHDDTVAKLYQGYNLEAEGQFSESPHLNSASLGIGYCIDPGTYAIGMIDSVRLMNRVLEPDEFLHYPLAQASLVSCSCSGKKCGDDGCGVSCGTCESDEVCKEGTCWPDQIILKPNVVILEEAVAKTADPKACGDIMRFPLLPNGTSPFPLPEGPFVIVAGYMDHDGQGNEVAVGFLCRVPWIERISGELILHTEQGSLSDVIEKGTLTIIQNLPIGNNTRRKDLGVELTIQKQTLYEDEENGISVTLNPGILRYEPVLDVTATYGLMEGPYFRATLTGTSTLQVGLDATWEIFSHPFINKEIPLYAHPFPFAFPIGPLPVAGIVWVNVDLTAEAGISGTFDASYGIERVETSMIGAEYSNGSWKKIDSPPTKTTTIDGPNEKLEGNAHAGIGVDVSVRLDLYGIPGPKLYIEPNAQADFKGDFLKAQYEYKIQACLDAGIDYSVGFNIGIIHIELPKYHAEIFEPPLCWNIKEERGLCWSQCQPDQYLCLSSSRSQGCGEMDDGDNCLDYLYKDCSPAHPCISATGKCECECSLSDGPCCDGCYFKPGTELCDQQSHIECHNGTNPGDDVFICSQEKFCTGNSSTCDGAWSACKWSIKNYCGPDKQCVEGNLTCQPVQYECSSGPCCDSSGRFLPPTHICDPNLTEYSCTSDKVCGNSVVIKKGIQYCSGDNSDCVGEKQWQPTTEKETCSQNQACVSWKTDASCSCNSNCNANINLSWSAHVDAQHDSATGWTKIKWQPHPSGNPNIRYLVTRAFGTMCPNYNKFMWKDNIAAVEILDNETNGPHTYGVFAYIECNEQRYYSPCAGADSDSPW